MGILFKVAGLRSLSQSESLSLSMCAVPNRPFDSDIDSDTDSEPAGLALLKVTISRFSIFHWRKGPR